ncbi:hypothetical protein ZWY2020_050330 [Hordeum vulgare]|nr:hypothetical protein ZWY2020_050330 [Hordeum vulgare]
MAAVLLALPVRVRTGVGMMGLPGTCPQRPCLLLRFPPRPRLRRRRRLLVLPLVVLAACQGAPEQEALDPPARVNRQRSREDTMCINCGCAGHYCSECEAPPRCPTTLAYLGYGTERGNFYFVDAEIEEVAARPHLATVTFEPEQPIPDGLVILSDLIRDELAAYIGDFRGSEFAWEVTETAPLVFSVPFPSTELLRVCSHGPIRCPLNQLMISVQAATSEPDPVPPLEKVWVLVYGLPRGGGSVAPRGGKLTHILKAISEPVGKLITADLASFEDDGPARIEILCPALAEIVGLSLVFYFGSKGRRLTFELESPASVVQPDPTPSGPEPGDGGLDEEGGSSEEGSSSEGDDDMVGAPPELSDGRRNPAPSVAGQSEHAGGSTVGSLAPVVAVGTEVILPASPIPVVAAEEEVSLGMEVYPASSPRSPGVVCYSRSPGSPLPHPWGPRIRALRWPSTLDGCVSPLPCPALGLGRALPRRGGAPERADQPVPDPSGRPHPDDP